MALPRLSISSVQPASLAALAAAQQAGMRAPLLNSSQSLSINSQLGLNSPSPKKVIDGLTLQSPDGRNFIAAADIADNTTPESADDAHDSQHIILFNNTSEPEVQPGCWQRNKAFVSTIISGTTVGATGGLTVYKLTGEIAKGLVPQLGMSCLPGAGIIIGTITVEYFYTGAIAKMNQAKALTGSEGPHPLAARNNTGLAQWYLEHPTVVQTFCIQQPTGDGLKTITLDLAGGLNISGALMHALTVFIKELNGKAYPAYLNYQAANPDAVSDRPVILGGLARAFYFSGLIDVVKRLMPAMEAFAKLVPNAGFALLCLNKLGKAGELSINLYFASPTAVAPFLYGLAVSLPSLVFTQTFDVDTKLVEGAQKLEEIHGKRTNFWANNLVGTFVKFIDFPVITYFLKGVFVLDACLLVGTVTAQCHTKLTPANLLKAYNLLPGFPIGFMAVYNTFHESSPALYITGGVVAGLVYLYVQPHMLENVAKGPVVAKALEKRGEVLKGVYNQGVRANLTTATDYAWSSVKSFFCCAYESWVENIENISA